MKTWYLLMTLLIVAVPAFAEDRVGDVWPLDTCVVAGEKLGSMGDPLVKLQDGREVRFCCAGCIKTLAKEPASFLQKADAAIIALQEASYPLTTCLNSDEPLGDKPVVAVIGNRLAKACCKDCMAAAQKDPAATIAKLDKAVIAKQKPSYKLTTCAVSDHKLEGDGTEIVLAGTYVKLCCADCKAGAEKHPTAILEKVAKAK